MGRWDGISFEDRTRHKIVEGEPGPDGTPCHIWTGYTSADGYGKVFFEGRMRSTHIVIYERTKGPVPHGLVLDHLCRRPPCVNPNHLEAVTQRENLLRGDTVAARHAAQTHCQRGHEFNERNTLISSQGSRLCRTCRAAREYGRRHHMSVDQVLFLQPERATR